MKTKFKPYDLAWVSVLDRVERGSRRFIGEVLSMPTPIETIMVRSVPGYPGTLREVSLGALEAVTTKYKYVAFARVGGKGSFPTDMLRYDCCCPLNFALVDQEYRTVAEIDEQFGFTDLIVARAVERLRGDHFTAARWQSFLWGCKEIAVLPINEHLTQEQAMT